MNYVFFRAEFCLKLRVVLSHVYRAECRFEIRFCLKLRLSWAECFGELRGVSSCVLSRAMFGLEPACCLGLRAVSSYGLSGAECCIQLCGVSSRLIFRAVTFFLVLRSFVLFFELPGGLEVLEQRARSACGLCCVFGVLCGANVVARTRSRRFAHYGRTPRPSLTLASLIRPIVAVVLHPLPPVGSSHGTSLGCSGIP